MDREYILLDVLRSSDKLSIEDARKILGVSESTVRRLCIKLEREGKVIRTLGGIQAVAINEISYHYDRLDSENIKEKSAIGRRAAALVEDGDVIFLDSGTTLSRMCVELSKRKLRNITVFTNSLVNFNILNNDITINLIGGEYRAHRKDFYGYLAEEVIKLLRFRKCFLGTDGFSLLNGFTTTDFNTSSMAKAVTERSDIIYVLADSSKYNKSSMVSYARMTDINSIITDKASDAMRSDLIQAGVELILAES